MSQGSSHQSGGWRHRMAVIVDEGSNPFELAVATELFGLRRPELDRPWYELTLCAATPAVRMHAGLFTLTGVAGLDAVEDADTVIVPNRPDPQIPPAGAVLTAIGRAAARGARLVSFCTGAFTLAAAGVLDGRRATTHWRWADLFAAHYPNVDLEPDVLFVDDGDILTAAGSAAALDLGLYLIRRDHGAEVTTAASRRLVFAAHRDGGQRQFIDRPVPTIPDASLAPLLAWAQQHLDRPLTVADLADRAAVSQATLHRRFRAELGTTPLAWLTAERVALACNSSNAANSASTSSPTPAGWAPPPTSATSCAGTPDSAPPPTATDSDPAPAPPDRATTHPHLAALRASASACRVVGPVQRDVGLHPQPQRLRRRVVRDLQP